jgi:hypothetical protein
MRGSSFHSGGMVPVAMGKPWGIDISDVVVLSVDPGRGFNQT